MDVVNTLGKKRIEKIYDLADVYHSDNIDRVSDDFIVESGMKEGNFDNVKACGYLLKILCQYYPALQTSSNPRYSRHFNAFSVQKLI